MTLSTILTMIVGLVLPAIVALVTKETMPEHVKVLLLLFLSVVSGALSSILGAVPTTLTGWEHVLLNILLTFMAGAAADLSAWKPSGASAAISRSTKNFGFG